MINSSNCCNLGKSCVTINLYKNTVTVFGKIIVRKPNRHIVQYSTYYFRVTQKNTSLLIIYDLLILIKVKQTILNICGNILEVMGIAMDKK